MADDPRRLPRAETIPLPGGGELHLRYERHDFYRTDTNIVHLTPDAADTMKQVTYNQYAVPAQEETKRAVSNERLGWGVLAVLVIAMGLACAFPASAWAVVVIAGVLTGGAGLYKIVDRLTTTATKAQLPDKTGT